MSEEQEVNPVDAPVEQEAPAEAPAEESTEVAPAEPSENAVRSHNEVDPA